MEGNPLRKIITSALAVGSVAASLALAAPAAAASFGPVEIGDSGSTYSYNDGEDRLCAKALNSPLGMPRRVVVHAHPVTAGRGPTRDFIDYNDMFVDGAGNTCRSLATAYEDTQYYVVARAYDLYGGQWYQTGSASRHFYS